MKSSNSILLVLAKNQFNETEFLTVRKFIEKSQFNLFIASDTDTLCIGDSGLRVKPDISFYNMHENNFKSLIIIGGIGIKEYWNNQILFSLVKKFYVNRKFIAAICSAPVIFARTGILSGKKATCFPTDKNELEREGVIFLNEAVVIDGNIITAEGPKSVANFIEVLINKLSE